jgi:hypothetical protein
MLYHLLGNLHERIDGGDAVTSCVHDEGIDIKSQ